MEGTAPASAATAGARAGFATILPHRRLPTRPDVRCFRYGHEFHICCHEQFAAEML